MADLAHEQIVRVQREQEGEDSSSGGEAEDSSSGGERKEGRARLKTKTETDVREPMFAHFSSLGPTHM